MFILRWRWQYVLVFAALATVLLVHIDHHRRATGLLQFAISSTHIQKREDDNAPTSENQRSNRKSKYEIAIVTVLDKTEVAEFLKPDSSFEQDAFFKGLLHSFCQTASLGHKYNFHVGFHQTDEAFKKKKQLFVESFLKTINRSCSPSIKASISLSAIPNTDNKTLAVIDTMRHAFLKNNDYFYLVDSQMKMESTGWVEIFIETLLRSSSSANLGVVLPKDVNLNAKHNRPFYFLHRNHFDIFGLFYLFETKNFGDWWLKEVYGDKYVVNPKVKVSCNKVPHSLETPVEVELDKMKAAVQESRHLIDKWTKGYDIKPSTRQIISFSLFGDAPRYAFGAIRNAQLTRLFMPLWTPRFYVVENGTKYSIPGEDTVVQLKRLGSEIKVLPAETVNKAAPMLWRFLAGDDPLLDVYIVRDSDSCISEREADLVEEWLKTDAGFHCIRDHPYHGNFAIMAGLFGAKQKEVKKHLGHSWRKLMPNYGAGYMEDMTFLNTVIWPKVQNYSLCHDSVSCIKYPKTAPIVAPREKYFHIGAVFDEYDQMRPEDVDIIKKAGENKDCTNMENFKQKQKRNTNLR